MTVKIHNIICIESKQHQVVTTEIHNESINIILMGDMAI